MAPLEAIPELDENEQAVLAEIVAAAPEWWVPADEAAAKSPLFWLGEMGLVTSRAEGGWQATELGIRARGAAR